MGWSEYSIRLACVSLLLLATTLSGCGTIGGMILGGIVSSQERAEIDSLCARRCSELKGDDYQKCHKACLYEEERRRAEDKRQWEQDQKDLDKRLAEEQPKIQQK